MLRINVLVRSSLPEHDLALAGVVVAPRGLVCELCGDVKGGGWSDYKLTLQGGVSEDEKAVPVCTELQL